MIDADRPVPSDARGNGESADEPVLLFDVDNTLLDNDRVQHDLRARIEGELGPRARDRYWAILEGLREALGYVDYLGAFQRFRIEQPVDPRVLALASWLLDYPFRDRLFPDALAVLRHAGRTARVVILSDGDAVLQPRKVIRSGLWEAAEGRVLIFVHKEEMLAEVERLFPARHYVLIDDKLRILSAVKAIWGERVTTVFARQGHYARDPKTTARYPAADASIHRIGDLLAWHPTAFGRPRPGS
ncbi:MAG: HAD family hydrolase [Myxococcota bacterium]